MPAMPTRTWNWFSSCSELRISLPRMGALDRLLALAAPLRHEQQPGHRRPEDGAEERADEDRPARERVTGCQPHDEDCGLGSEQDQRDVQRLQHGSEPKN